MDITNEQLEKIISNEIDKCKSYGCEETQIAKCMHYTNLIPRWSEDKTYWFVDKIKPCYKKG